MVRCTERLFYDFHVRSRVSRARMSMSIVFYVFLQSLGDIRRDNLFTRKRIEHWGSIEERKNFFHPCEDLVLYEKDVLEFPTMVNVFSWEGTKVFGDLTEKRKSWRGRAPGPRAVDLVAFRSDRSKTLLAVFLSTYERVKKINETHGVRSLDLLRPFPFLARKPTDLFSHRFPSSFMYYSKKLQQCDAIKRKKKQRVKRAWATPCRDPFIFRSIRSDLRVDESCKTIDRYLHVRGQLTHNRTSLLPI